jgi:hypothetical protein
VFPISAVARAGLDELLEVWWREVRAIVDPAPDPGAAPLP